MTALTAITVFANDIQSLSRFYADVFELSEIEQFTTPIFRALDAGSTLLGFSALEAYALLNMSDRANPRGTKIMVTFEAKDRAHVSTLVDRAVSHGARLIKPTFDTYYGAYQAVLADPEGNAFRINKMPEGQLA
jgi:predicted enzyme related to lactoylglutathione lyase